MGAEKEAAKKLIDRLPETASWDDIIYELYVKKRIAEGLAALDGGDVVSHEEVEKRFSGK